VASHRRGILDYFEGTLNSDLTSVKLSSMAWCVGLLPEIVNILAGSSLSSGITSSIAHLERFAADCSGQQLSFLPRIVSDELNYESGQVQAYNTANFQPRDVCGTKRWGSL
jgi:hypothetical protein